MDFFKPHILIFVLPQHILSESTFRDYNSLITRQNMGMDDFMRLEKNKMAVDNLRKIRTFSNVIENHKLYLHHCLQDLA